MRVLASPCAFTIVPRGLLTVRKTPRDISIRATVCFGSGGGGLGGGRGGGGGGDGRGDRGDDWQRPRRGRVARLLAAAAAFELARPKSAHAKGKQADLQPRLDALDFTALFSQEFGISGVVGVGAGLIFRALGLNIAIAAASFFAALRWLELNDLVDVKWKNVHAFAQRNSKFLDINGDGRVDQHDFFALKAKIVNFYTAAVPSAAGFAAGFTLGIRL